MLDGRIAALGEIEQSQNNINQAREALRQAEHEQVSAWAAALSAGWTETELRKLGLDAPAGKRPGRPKGARTKRTDLPPAQSVNVPNQVS